jgi:hypothetical protein
MSSLAAPDKDELPSFYFENPMTEYDPTTSCDPGPEVDVQSEA